MEINILGALSLTCGQRSAEVASKRVSTVLTLLALSPGTPIPFDQLVDELWADQPMGNARNALQANVSRLRRLLESVTRTPSDGIVRTVSSGYLLDVPAEAVDVHRFVALASAGAGLVHKDPAEAVEKLERALGLWRGPALMDARDGLRCRVQAAHLEERRLTVYEDLVAAKLAACSERISLPELRQLAADHSERERLTELLMLALYREGRQAEALDVFHGARRRLAAELGLEPGPALHLVYQAILNQDPMLGQPRHVLLYAAPAS
ncbi:MULTISPECIES: AfsR/SARP family transcriptional regulator [Streptomyces]|uniref:AfsR/SARP family transcriptional regulator n=1 Tax=Streptomyces TaxID=1883 RepID=UPI000998220B|nr:AfsR/SARP family transcriptional regulator [Streptomyces sp. st77]MYX04943.1 SARP family transcriptional regulator [Streptomyces sp. SID8378]SNB89532.1 DNA-binding transcriptional activator of the SARP family [Streptomyces sp. PgraA7]